MNEQRNRTDPATEQPEWLKNAVQGLDQQQQSIDYVTRSKLSAARARAIDTHDQQNQFSWRFFNPGFAAAALVLLACGLLFFNTTKQPEVNPGNPMASQDLPILASNEELDFFQNLEMLEWIESNAVDLEQPG